MRYAPATALTLLFTLLAAAVARDATSSFDAAVRDATHRLASPELTALAQLLSLIGSNLVWVAAAAIASVALWLTARRTQTSGLVLTMAGAIAWENGLKLIFHRLRPESFFGVSPPTYSFPSGHALFACCLYGALAAIAARDVTSAALRTCIWAAALLMALGIGLSRVYLGLHYPSDVLGGYLAGGAWLAFLGASGAFSFPRKPKKGERRSLSKAAY